MANRHTNKKLRIHVRSRMARTGESYQKALTALLHEEPVRHRRSSVDLMVVHYFGLPITLAVFEATEPLGHPIIMRVPSSRDAATNVGLPLMNLRSEVSQ